MSETKPANRPQGPEKGSLPYLQARNRTRRMNLLLILAFTVINVALIFTDANSYFLFSALLPYWLFGFGYLQRGYRSYGSWRRDFAGVPGNFPAVG